MPSYYNQVNSLGPKIWYRFNETSGTPANSGSLSTTTTFTDYTLNQTTIIDGKSVSLNGTSSYAQLPAHSANALFDDKSFTVEAWVKIATADTNRSAPLEIFRLNPASSPHTTISLVVDGTAGTRGKAKLSSAWTTDILSTNRIDDGLWHHVVYTYNTSSVKLYIDGSINSSTTPSGLPTSFNFDTSTKKIIGAGYTGISQASIGQYFKGNIDEFAVYDYELTSTNISDNRTAGISRTIDATAVTASALMPEPLAVYDILYNLAVNDGAAYIYKFNSTLTDVYSNSSGHTFTATNSGYSYKPGETPSITGGSWYPTTSTPNLAFGESATPLFNNMKGMSLEFVFYLDAQVTDNNYKTLFIKEFGGQYYAVALNPGSTGNVLQVQINNSDYYTFNSTEMAVDQWHHVVFEWGAKDNKLTAYIDGTKSQSTSSYASSQNNFRDNYNITLGARDVWIDFLAIYATDYNANSYLTDADVTIHKTAMLSGIVDMYNPMVFPNTVTASALIPNPTINISFNPEQGVATASALMRNPEIVITSQAGVMTASAELVLPFGLGNATYHASAVTAFATMVHPAISAIRNVNYGTGALTAIALFQLPFWSHDSGLSSSTLLASAFMPDPSIDIAGLVRANAKTANALMVNPAVSTTKNASIRPQSLNASAFAPLPPQYFTVADDLWYQRLVAIDQKDTVGNSSIVFFNTSNNFYVPSDPIPGSGWTATAAINGVTNPLPAINGGYFDAQNRKAVNFRNIGITTGAPGSAGDRDFTFEVMIKTTKSNQVLFVGENENIYNFQRTGIILRDGKLALTYSKDRSAGSVSANDQDLAFTGFKNIADGEWHHLIIQNRQTGIDGSAPRIQFWIDGQLDIQRYGNEMYVINRVGYNSSELNSYSDFTLSAFGLGLSAMVEENEINLNYLAAINVVPVKAGVATATATATPNTKGRGNRGRALMLYFWPTQNYTTGIYKSPVIGPPTGLNVVGNNYHTYDQGGYGSDPDTFYQLTTYLNQGASAFYDWDIWPVPVTNLFAGDQWVGESHPILKDGIFKIGTDKGDVYVDAVTDNERYLNLMTDLKDLSQFDMICFRNYPDQSLEQDKYGVNAKGVVDEYFNLLDKNLFADFLKSLREAVDTGISLLITNPQLAVDMGFIDTYHEVSDLTDSGNEGLSDPYVPVKINDPLNTGTPQLSIDYPTSLTGSGNDSYLDAYRNNYHEVVNTLTDLTDDAAFIWTDEIKYRADQSEFGELDRWWSHVEYNDGLQVGDKFLISTTPTYSQTYFATPLDAVRAGKVITKFADTYRFGLVERVNPYRNYATSIAVEPGTVVAGKQIGAKVFISFTDVVGTQQYGNAIGGQGVSIEQKQVSLKTDYWINYAYSVGLLTVEERDNLLLDSIDRGPASPARDADAYWTTNGVDIVGTLSAYADNDELSLDSSEQAKKQKVLKRTRRGKPKRTISAGALPNFMVLWGWATRQISVPVPSINTRALWWLSERLEYADGLPQRPVAFDADAFMPQPTVTGYKTATVAAQPGLAVAAIIETNLRDANVTIGVLPLTATALFVEKGILIPAQVATAIARTPQDIRTITLESDQIVLYLVHVDPILYLREDVIK
jgi:hypothetical protein